MSYHTRLKHHIAPLLLLALTLLALLGWRCYQPGSSSGWELLGLLCFGVVAGYFGGLLGIGGGIILLPLLTFVWRYPTSIAVGTTLFAVVFTALSGGWAHWQRGNVHRPGLLFIGVGGFLGIIIGSSLFSYLAAQVKTLNLVLCLFFIFPGFMMLREGLWKKDPAPSNELPPLENPKLKLTSLGMFTGFLTGLLGLGGGFILVPAMTYLFAYPIYLAVGTSLVAIIPITLVGGIIKLWQSYVLLEASLALAAGSIIGAQLGAVSMRNFKPATLKLLFGLYFAYTSLRLILTYWS